jgi:hypothetical protein
MDNFVRVFWDNRCATCGRYHSPGEAAFPIDHWQPLSGGSVLAMSNAVLLCSHCNSVKGCRAPETVYSTAVFDAIAQKLRQQVAAWEIHTGFVEGLTL